MNISNFVFQINSFLKLLKPPILLGEWEYLNKNKKRRHWKTEAYVFVNKQSQKTIQFGIEKHKGNDYIGFETLDGVNQIVSMNLTRARKKKRCRNR